MSINTKGAIEIQTRVFDEVMDLLRKNSILSERKKRLITLLESGDGSLFSRDRITEIISNIDVNGGSANTINLNENQKNELISYGSLEEKLAYIISLSFDSNDKTATITSSQIIALINSYINQIEKQLNNGAHFSQKFIIRHAAFNRFNPKLDFDKQAKLDGIVEELNGLVEKEKLDYSFHFSKETDAQKIMKIKEGLRMIRNANISKDGKESIKKIIGDFKELNKELEPLESLDKAYTDLSAALNNMYTINRDSMSVRGESSMITSSEDIRRLRIALGIIEGKSDFNLDDYVGKLFDNNKIDINVTLEEIMRGGKIKEALAKSNLTEKHFTRSFLEHISQELVIQAKHKLDIKKREVFGNKKKDFDNDINAQRDIQRKKIIEIGEKIGTSAINNVSGNDLLVLTSYLRLNKHVFRNGGDEQENTHIRRALEIAIETICPNISDQERFTLRDSILTQNCHINNLFYGDDNAFKRKDALKLWGHSALNHARRISEHTSILSKNYGQKTAKMILGGAIIAAGAAAVSTVGAGAILAGLGVAAGAKLGAKGLDKGLGAYHSWVNTERKGWKNYMFMPLKAGKLLTYPLQKLGYGIDIGTDKAADVAVKTRKKVNEIVAGNIGNQDWIKKLTDDKVNNLFSLLAAGINGTIRLGAEGTTLVSNVGLDILDTHEKRTILKGIYSTENSQNLREFAEQVEIQSLIQEDLGLFEDDGYVETLSVTEKKEEKNDKQKEFLKGMSNFKGIVENIAENLKISIDGLPDNSEEKQIKKYVTIILKQMIGLLEKPEHGNFFNSIKGVVDNCLNTLGIDKDSATDTRYKVLGTRKEELEGYKKILIDARKNLGTGKGVAEESKNYSEQIRSIDNEIKDINNAMGFISHINGGGFIKELNDIIKDKLENPLKLYKNGDIADFNSKLSELMRSLETINTTII